MYTCTSGATPFGQALRALAFTLVEIKFTRKSKQVFHRFTTSYHSIQVNGNTGYFLVEMFFFFGGGGLAFTCSQAVQLSSLYRRVVQYRAK